MRGAGIRTAFVLLGLTIVYNVIEGVVAIWSGLDADSPTLIAFGADSYLEVMAASAVVWRLASADEEVGEQREQRVLRFIGVTFLVLAAAVAVHVGFAVAGQRGAGASIPGIILLAVSLTVMPIVALMKLRTAAHARLPALAAEARETLACAYLSLTAFAGLVASAIIGWWWIDPLAALLLTPWLVREGLEGLRGEACHDGAVLCFCRACLWGIRDCARPCCSPAPLLA